MNFFEISSSNINQPKTIAIIVLSSKTTNIFPGCPENKIHCNTLNKNFFRDYFLKGIKFKEY